MSTSQEKPGERHDTLPGNETSPLNEPVQSIGHLAPTGFDNLPPVPADAVGAQYQYGGTMPIVAPAAHVQPAVGEVQL